MANSANVGNSHIFMIGLVVSGQLLVVKSIPISYF